jgi:Ca2+-binding RTX toxin-like protein
MAAYAFHTITAEQARTMSAADRITFAGGPASSVGVVYRYFEPAAPGQVTVPVVPWIEVTYRGRTVNFATEIVQVADAGGLVFEDGSMLHIGDAAGDSVSGSGLGDALYGGPGADALYGAAGDDLIQGNTGSDTLSGGAGVDTIYGGQGDDVITTSRGFVPGSPPEEGDWAHGNLGDDEIIGGRGSDTLYGGQGQDFLGGSDGEDYLSGDLGDDELMGGQGADTLVGGAGNDILNGGGGRDQLSGGEGRDRFEIVAKSRPGEGSDDVILDWSAEDQITFAQVSIFSILPREYSEFVAPSYELARLIANDHVSAGAVHVAAQVGADVIVFADTDGDRTNGADSAVVLVGRSLNDISLLNFG